MTPGASKTTKSLFQDHKKRACAFCRAKEETVDYKDISTLKSFFSDMGKIVPRRISGNCAKHQRYVTRAIKRARNIALIGISELF